MPFTGLGTSPPVLGPRARLEGAHGEEVVRAVLPCEALGKRAVVSAGEDGMVRVWTMDGQPDGSEMERREADESEEQIWPAPAVDRGAAEKDKDKKSKRRRSEKQAREKRHFQPY